MFTGIIEEIGTVKAIQKSSRGAKLLIEGSKVLNNTKIGDSISVNGVCLTAAKITSYEFTTDVMPETMSLTNLGSLKNGDYVNLERALRVGDRLGGHIVSGHIDGVALKLSQIKQDNAFLISYGAPPNILKYLIKKGSIAIDGVSLTIVSVASNSFTVSIIPTTKLDTTIVSKGVGKMVNIECDLVGKYIERFVCFENIEEKKGITLDFLKENNFI